MRKGVTLLEILVAMGLLTAVMIVMLTLFAQMHRLAEKTEGVLADKHVAQELIANLTMVIESTLWDAEQVTLSAGEGALNIHAKLPIYGRSVVTVEKVEDAEGGTLMNSRYSVQSLDGVDTSSFEKNYPLEMQLELHYYIEDKKERLTFDPPFAIKGNTLITAGGHYNGYPLSLALIINREAPVPISFISRPL